MNEDPVLHRILELSWKRGLSQSDLADALGLSRSAVTEWKAGRSFAYKRRLPEIAEIIGVSLDFLVSGKEPDPTPTNFISLPHTKRVPLVGDIACGEPILAVENVVDFVNVPLDVNADMALVCKGDSMTGARIMDGDVVYIRQQPEVENGEIAAVLVGDEATLKRVFIKGNHVILAPCNPAYDVMVYTGDEIEQVRIIGKAVAFTSAVR